MYRNQFRPDRFNDTNIARRPGRGGASGTHHWVVSGGRGNAAPGTQPRSPPNRSVRPGTVQQYRPRSPACVVPQGNATNCAPVENANATRTEQVNQASLGSFEKQKPPIVPDQSDVLNLDTAKGARAADSSTPAIHSEEHSSTAFTLQFGTLSPGVINTQCDPCSASAPSDINDKKHEKEQQKQEATDNLVVCSRTDLIDKNDSLPGTMSSNSCEVPEPELPQTPVLNSVPPADKVCMDSKNVLPRNPSSPTHQQWQKQDIRKDAINASRSDTLHKYPATKPKMSVQIPPPYTPNIAPPPFVLPLNGRPLPVAFQQKQPQVPVEFRGPGMQMQSIGSVSGSMAMKMGAPMGNAPHVPPFFVHGAQPRAFQQPAFIHQGPGLGCAPPASPHLSQLGNTRITQEPSQQQPRSCDEQKRTVRITHPDTHEELMLNRRGHSYMDAASGQIPLHNVNQLPHVPAFQPLHNVYYRPNMYNAGHVYLPNTSTVVSNRQMCPKMQPPRQSFDPTINNQAVASISPPIPNPWLDANSRPPTNLRSASEVSSFKGLLSFDISASGQETPTSSRFSGEANSGIHCSMSPQSVLTQQTQTGPALVDHATSIACPQIISACNLTPACVADGASSVEAKPVVAEESSPVPEATSSCSVKIQSYHILPLQSETSLDTETSLGSKNSIYEGDSILGKPPLICTQEILPPKFPANSLFPEGLKTKDNPLPFPEETYEANCSVTLQMQDGMSEEYVVNAEVMCSKSKAERVDVTMPGAASGSENGTDVSKLVRFPACTEPGLSLSIGDLPPSNKICGFSADAQIVPRQPENKLKDSILDSVSITRITAVVSDSTSSRREIEDGIIGSGVSNHCSAAAATTVQTKKPVLEATKTKTTHGRRKRRKEIHTEADGQKSADIYDASGSLDENFESFRVEEVVRSSSTADLKEFCTLDAEVGTPAGISDDNQNKNDSFDWEGDAEISSEKSRVYSCKNSNNGAEINKDGCDQKRYSRDFLLTFAHSCINLPEDFKIGSDIYDAVMNVSTELNPNRARIKDRVSAISQVNRHMRNSKLEENYWRKSYSSPVSGRDPLPDIAHRPAISSWDAAQCGGRGSSRSVSQNQSPSQYNGEILSRAMKEVTCQRSMSRGSVDQKWQHRANQGTSSPQVSMPLMHKAEKKYEIGKVSDEEEVKQRQLKAILNKLTPQNFEKLFEQVKNLNIDNIVTLNGVISQIFDKALMEPTFCEMYASFCFSLAGELPNFVKDGEKITFKRLLLNKCQEEFERGEREQAEADKAEEEGGIKQSKGEIEEKRLRARRRMLGNIRLIGELYKKKMLTERIMHECIKKLLGEYQHPDEEDLEALCKLMSTIGEMIDHYRAKVHMDFYFDIIQQLSANSKLSSRIRFMLEDVIDLRNNKWRQRRKVEGPKKIEEVHRDAVKQKTSQSSRLGSSLNYSSSGATISSALRQGPPPDYGVRGSSTSRGSSQVRTYGSQNINVDARYQTSNRVISVPLHQRRSDKSIRLTPQGELGREMSLCGKPQASHDILPEVPLISHRVQALKSPRQSSFAGATSNQTNFQVTADTPKSLSWGTADHALPVLVTPVNPVSQMHTQSAVMKGICYEARIFPEEVLQEKAILTIKEFYSAKDEKEVGLCMKELNAPSFYPSLISLWINDSFERKDLERELLAKLLVNLCKSHESLLSQRVLLQGFQHVLSTLEDAVTDAPKATEFLGRLFAKIILEDVLSLTEIGVLLQDGGDEPAGPAPDQSLASEVLGSMLESIRVERGDSAVDEIRAKSNLQWESLRRPGLCV